MPEPLRWNMILPNGEPLRYDMGPDFRWDGDVPEYLYNQTQKVMTQNILDLNISDADWLLIDAALVTLETKLGAKLADLNVQQRKELVKMGDKSEAFGRQNAASLPPQTVTDLTAEEGDLTNLDKLRPRLARLMSLNEKAGDSEMALGSDIMVYCLTLYGGSASRSDA